MIVAPSASVYQQSSGRKAPYQKILAILSNYVGSADAVVAMIRKRHTNLPTGYRNKVGAINDDWYIDQPLGNGDILPDDIFSIDLKLAYHNSMASIIAICERHGFHDTNCTFFTQKDKPGDENRVFFNVTGVYRLAVKYDNVFSAGSDLLWDLYALLKGEFQLNNLPLVTLSNKHHYEKLIARQIALHYSMSFKAFADQFEKSMPVVDVATSHIANNTPLYEETHFHQHRNVASRLHKDTEHGVTLAADGIRIGHNLVVNILDQFCQFDPEFDANRACSISKAMLKLCSPTAG